MITKQLKDIYIQGGPKKSLRCDLEASENF